MSFNSSTRVAGPLNGNGSTTVFAFAFKVFVAADVLVVKTSSAGVETQQTLTTHYTVSLNADQNLNPGGSITMVTAPATGEKITISSKVVESQPLVIRNQTAFYPKNIEDALDRGAIISQQLANKLARAITFPISDGTSLSGQLPSASNRANKLLGFDASGNVTTSSGSLAALEAAAAIVGADIVNIDAVAANLDDIVDVAADLTNIDTVATNITNVNTVATNIASVNTNAANITAIQNASANAATATTKAGEALVSANAAASSAAAAAATVTGFSAGAIVGFATKAAMDADLAYAAGTVAWVLSDSTLSNNIMYRKVGSSGSGSWAASTDRISLVDNRLQVVEGNLYPCENTDWSFIVLDASGHNAGGVDASGKWVPTKILLPATASISDDANTPLTSRLVPGGTAALLEGEQSYQYAFAILDPDNNMKFAVPFQGDILGRVAEATKAYSLEAGTVTESSLSSSLQTSLSTNRYVTELIGASLFVHDRAGGTRALISSSTPTEAQIIDNTYVAYKESGSWLYKPVAGGTANVVLPTSRLTLWGDSLTAASTGVSAVGSVLGITTLNRGASGYGTSDIAIRQGGLNVYFNAAGAQIPASGAVALTLVNSPTTGYRVGSSITWTGTLAGVAGTLTKATDETWSFTRTSSGSITSCPNGTAFICDSNTSSGETKNDVQSIWMGRNNVGNATFHQDTLDNVARCVAYIKPLYKRFVVISVTNSTSEGTGTSGYNSIVAVNQALANIYGGRFYDLRADFIANGLATAGISATAQDLIDIAADRPPSSLMADSVHPNSAGYGAQKTLFANWLTSKGYFA